VRTAADLSATITSIARVAIKYLVQRGRANPGNDAWLDTPPEGVRLPMPGGENVIVLTKHETRPGLVVATVLDKLEQA
jgi:hypothetical protein